MLSLPAGRGKPAERGDGRQARLSHQRRLHAGGVGGRLATAAFHYEYVYRALLAKSRRLNFGDRASTLGLRQQLCASEPSVRADDERLAVS